MWILFGFECICRDAFKAGTLKTEQQTFYKESEETKDERDQERKEEGRNHLVAN